MKAPGASLRLPLQTGRAALDAVAVASVCLAIAVPLLFVGALTFMSGLFWLLLLGLLPAWVGVSFFIDGVRARPSDIELDAEGARIVGGSNDGLRASWKELGETKIGNDVERGDTLVLRVRGVETVVAATMDEDELASMKAVRRTLEALRKAKPRAEMPAAGAARVLACAKCGGIAEPSEEATVTCRFCSAEVAIPPHVREKVAAYGRHSKTRQRIERRVAQYLGGASLSRARWSMVVPFVAMGAWLVIFGVGVVWYAHGAATAWGILLLDVALGLLPPGLCALFAYPLLARQAAPILALDLGALPPSRPGEPHACRHCGGPLVEPKESVVSRCVFCDADNILGFRGLALDSAMTNAKKQAGLLESTVDRTRRARARWLRIGVATAAACLVGSLIAFLRVRANAPVLARDVHRITWSPFDDAREPLPSTDGKKIRFVIQEHTGKNPRVVLGVVSASGGIGRELNDNETKALFVEPGNPAPDPDCGHRQSILSPDRRLVAYVADCSSPARLFVANADGRSPRQLTTGKASAAHPIWLGEWLYFDAGGSIYRLRPR